MKKYFLVIFILFAALINFNEVTSGILVNSNCFDDFGQVFEQTGEEDCAVIRIDPSFQQVLVTRIPILESKNPLKITTHIWKPPVNA